MILCNNLPRTCYNIIVREPEIIEAEIVENVDTSHAKRAMLTGEVSPLPADRVRANERPAWHTPGDHARPYGDRGGMLGGFLVLAIGFIVTAFVLLISVCIVLPFTLLMRLLGVHKHN